MTNPARKRVHPTWHPTWTPETERWSSALIRRWMNHPSRKWNLDPAIDGFDDILQDAKILFFSLEAKYPVANNMGHFGSLFKTSLSRMLIDRDRAKCRKITTTLLIDDLVDDPQLQGIPNYGYFNILLEEMPHELKMVLKALTSGRVRLKVERTNPPARPRENLNMRLKRRLPELSLSDPAGDLQRHLKYNH